MYAVEPWSDDVAAAIDVLPPSAFAAFAELRAALELSPWSVGEPFSRSNPDGPTRTAIIGLNAAWRDPEWGLLLWLTMLSGRPGRWLRWG